METAVGTIMKPNKKKPNECPWYINLISKTLEQHSEVFVIYKPN